MLDRIEVFVARRRYFFHKTLIFQKMYVHMFGAKTALDTI